jgi:hypothetical protein
MEPMVGGNLNLQLLYSVFFEFQNFSAFRADHVVMVLSQMPMFIESDAIVKLALVRKTETAHQCERFFDKSRTQLPAVGGEPLSQFVDRYMFFSLQECFKHLKSIFEFIDMFLFEQLFELLLFLNMDLFHLTSIGPQAQDLTIEYSIEVVQIATGCDREYRKLCRILRDRRGFGIVRLRSLGRRYPCNDPKRSRPAQTLPTRTLDI